MVKDKMPKVSVIVPTIGRKSLKDTIQSILDQSYKNIEIIVTDDTNNENSYEIIKNFFLKDYLLKKIIFIKNYKYKKGPSGNKNNGLDIISGDYFMFVDDDDIIYIDTIKILVETALNKNYDIILGNCLSSNNQIVGVNYNKECAFSYEDILSGKIDGEYTQLVKTAIIDNIKMNEDCWGAEHLFWWKLYKKVKNIYYINYNLKYYDTNIAINTEKVTSNMEKYSKRQSLNYYYTIKEFGEDLIKIKESQFLRYLIRGMYFTKLAEDKEKQIFYKNNIKMIHNKRLIFIGEIWYFTCKIMPKYILVLINKMLYTTIVPSLKKRISK